MFLRLDCYYDVNDLDAQHSFDVTCFRKIPSHPHLNDDDGECALNV